MNDGQRDTSGIPRAAFLLLQKVARDVFLRNQRGKEAYL